MIIVDNIVEYPAEMTTDKGLPGRKWCHLQSTDQSPAGEQELIAFGAKIGMQRRWLQHPGKPGRTHYDLTPSKRASAIKAGAVAVDLNSYTQSRLAGPKALAAYLAALGAPTHARPVFGQTPAREESRGCVNGGGRTLRT